MMKDRLVIGIFALVLTGATLAFAGAGSITVKDSAGVTRTYDVITDAGGNFVGMFGLCDRTAAANCAVVDSSGRILEVNSAAILSALGAATPAGTNLIGKVGVDQTTPGTTNGISIVGVNGATALAGTGAVGTGAQRVAVGTDTATIAGSAPGTAGTPSANVISIQGVTNGTTLPATEANSAAILNAVQTSIPAGTNIIGGVTLNSTPSLANGNGVVPTQGGTVLSTTNGMYSNILQGNVVLSATNPIFVQKIPPSTATGGMTTFFLQPVASDNHTNIKNGAGQVYWVLAENNSATVNYLRFYNAATGFNGCGSASNLITQIQIPASTSVGGTNINLPFGIPFSTGISICVTSAYATTDTTNATASAMSLTIGYN